MFNPSDEHPFQSKNTQRKLRELTRWQTCVENRRKVAKQVITRVLHNLRNIPAMADDPHARNRVSSQLMSCTAVPEDFGVLY